MHVVIFEGSQWTDFVPFSLTRPVFSLRVGAGTLLQKQLRATQPTRLTLWVRPEMEPFVKRYIEPELSIPLRINTPLDDEPAMIFSARTVHFARVERPETECVVLEEEDQLIRMAYVSCAGLTHEDVMHRTPRWLAIRELPQAMPQARFPRHWADLVAWNEEAILADSIYWTQPPPQGDRICMINPDNIHADPGVHISPQVILDASKGPILIEKGVSIGAHSVIEGPCHLGAGCRITPLSLIRPGTSLGPCCRIGGEVNNSIFQSYSNKSHDGFVGDSYVGEWVNLGAGTTTSNLKSTYGLIKLHLGSHTVQSERVLLGSAIGDHSKTATHTQLVAGSYVGVSSIITLSHRVPHVVPSFSFWTDSQKESMPVSKALEIAGRMLIRRSRSLEAEDQHLLRYAAEIAQKQGY